MEQVVPLRSQRRCRATTSKKITLLSGADLSEIGQNINSQFFETMTFRQSIPGRRRPIFNIDHLLQNLPARNLILSNPKPVSQTTAIYLRGHQGQGTMRKNLQSSKTMLPSYIASRHQAQALKFEMARRVLERHRDRFQRCLRSENRMYHEEIYRERSEASRRPILDRSRESRLANIVRKQGTVERQMARIRRQGSIEMSRRDEQEHRQYNDQGSRIYTWKL